MLKSFTFLDTIDQKILDQFVHTGAAMFSMAINLKVAQFCVADLERLNKVVIKQNFATCQDAFKKDTSIENFRDWTLNSTLAKSKQNFILTTKKKLVELLNDDSLDKENDTSNASAPKRKLLYPSTSKFTLPNNFQKVITVDSSSADNDQGPTIFKKKKQSFQEQCFPKKCLPNATNEELLTKNRRKKKTTKKRKPKTTEVHLAPTSSHHGHLEARTTQHVEQLNTSVLADATEFVSSRKNKKNPENKRI